MEHKKPIIQFKKVVKEYGDGLVGLDNINVEIHPGEFVFLIGSSGAGKTTLMKHIVKEEDPTEGEIFVDGEDLSKIKQNQIPFLRRKVGFIYQDFKLMDTKTAFENIALSLQVAGKPNDQIEDVVTKLIELVGLSGKENKFPNSLSGGEKQRLTIARALAHEPKILLADEPTGNLDKTATWVVVDLIKKINDWGTTIIFGTHDLDLVKSLKKRVIQIEKGKIVKDEDYLI